MNLRKLKIICPISKRCKNLSKKLKAKISNKSQNRQEIRMPVMKIKKKKFLSLETFKIISKKVKTLDSSQDSLRK